MHLGQVMLNDIVMMINSSPEKLKNYNNNVGIKLNKNKIKDIIGWIKEDKISLEKISKDKYICIWIDSDDNIKQS